VGSLWHSDLLGDIDNTSVVCEFGTASARHGSFSRSSAHRSSSCIPVSFSSGFGGTWLGARLFQSSWLVGSVRLSLPTFVFRSNPLDVLSRPRFNKKVTSDVTAKVGVPRESVARVASVVVSRSDGMREVVCRQRGCVLEFWRSRRGLAWMRDKTSLMIERGVAHSNTQRRGDESRNCFLNNRKEYR